jgi:RNA polymerase-binding transcription factor DksA
MRGAAYPLSWPPRRTLGRVEERERIEARLDARFEELKRTRLAMSRESDGMRGSEFAHADNHPGELGTETHEEELGETAEILFDEEERRIAEARRALADGSYGICVNCHRQIPPERLQAVPEAVRCLDCQRLFEGLHRQHTRPV